MLLKERRANSIDGQNTLKSCLTGPHQQTPPRNCANCRGITLLLVPVKVLNRIIVDRMKEVVDQQLRDQHAGFRKKRSCVDQIATLHQSLNKP